ncbi:MAG TPA: MBL fold metallo-hydrolase [Candidatus Limnocylindrales bacterium]|nr:MBL fold metallo-hydrolase [Candidatus Limnocylindrales bacterium]
MHFAFLGTSGAVPSMRRDNTSLVFVGRDEAVLLDCGGSPVQKLLLAAVAPSRLVHVVITHIHADHAYGLPALVQSLIVMGRTDALTVSCRAEHVEPLTAILRAFGLLDRAGAFPIHLVPVSGRAGEPVARTASFVISASGNAHGRMPNLAVRVDVPALDRAVVYSSDTEPCDAVVALARGADTLVHEATFSSRRAERPGAHSTAADAGEIATRASVRRLILTHLDRAYHDDVAVLLDEARERFAGPVEIAEEIVPYPI